MDATRCLPPTYRHGGRGPPDGDGLARAAAKQLNPKALLADNNGYAYFAALGDLVITGPTLTNINDFRAVLIDPA